MWNLTHQGSGRFIFDALILQQAFKKVLLMKKFLAVAMAVAAIAVSTSSESQAQHPSAGYGFGIGINQAQQGFGLRRGAFNRFNGFNGIGAFNSFAFRNVVREERQPFFAMNPPVYYRGIVKRPYGVSPFPAPAGIAPVELQMQVVDPVTVTNPFFKQASPASDIVEEKIELNTENKSTKVTNPYFIGEPEELQLTVPASYEVN